MNMGMVCLIHKGWSYTSTSVEPVQTVLTCSQRKRLHHSTSSKPHSNCRSLRSLFHYQRIFLPLLMSRSTMWRSPALSCCGRGIPVQCSTTHLRPGAGSTCWPHCRCPSRCSNQAQTRPDTPLPTEAVCSTVDTRAAVASHLIYSIFHQHERHLPGVAQGGQSETQQ